MKKLFTAFLLAAVIGLTGCPQNVQPQNPTEVVYTATQSLVVYDTWIVQQNRAGVLTGDRYEAMKALAKGARASLKDARTAAMTKDSDGYVVALTAANKALAELALYKGGQR